MARKRYIYTLTDPTSGAVRYVGCTVNPERRRAQVFYSFWGRDVIEWARDLRKSGQRPHLTVIEECRGNHAEREYYWIQHYLRRGCELLNKHGVTMRYSPNHPGVIRGE